jgi:predicted Zn-dependent protease
MAASRTQSGVAAWMLLLLILVSSPLSADPVSELPAAWADRLIPIAPTDVSGAERLMQEAIGAARADLASLLEDPDTTAEQLAEAYGRLGALFVLVEVEAVADRCLRNAATLQPGVFRWHYYRGYLAMLAGRMEDALRALEDARALDPDYAPLNLRLGKVLLDAGRLDEARVALERIRETPGLVAVSTYYLGQIANLQRRYPDAVAALERSLAVDPAPSGVQYQLAQAYRALGDLEKARTYLAHAGADAGAPDADDPLIAELEAVTGRSLPAFQEAMWAIQQADYAQAAARFAEGLAVDPENTAARVSLARARYLAGQPEAAERELTVVLEQAPGQSLARFLKGVLKEAQGDTAAAAEAYRATLTTDPRHAGAAFYLANLEFRGGRFSEAAAGYRAVLQSSEPAAPAVILELIAAHRSGVAEAELLARLEALIAQRSDDPMLQYALARLLAAARDPEQRDPQRAIELASKLVQAQPIPPYQRALALALMSAGRAEEATSLSESALAMAAWMAPPGELEQLMDELDEYRAGRLPADPWPEKDLLLNAPPLDARTAFRDYPASAPY